MKIEDQIPGFSKMAIATGAAAFGADKNESNVERIWYLTARAQKGGYASPKIAT